MALNWGCNCRSTALRKVRRTQSDDAHGEASSTEQSIALWENMNADAGPRPPIPGNSPTADEQLRNQMDQALCPNAGTQQRSCRIAFPAQ